MPRAAGKDAERVARLDAGPEVLHQTLDDTARIIRRLEGSRPDQDKPGCQRTVTGRPDARD